MSTSFDLLLRPPYGSHSSLRYVTAFLVERLLFRAIRNGRPPHFVCELLSFLWAMIVW